MYISRNLVNQSFCNFCPMSIEISLSIVIPTFNRHREFKQCLSSIINQVVPRELRLCIIVRDNSSDPSVRHENSILVHKLASCKNIYIEYLDVRRKGISLTGDHNIFESILHANTDYSWVLPDDDFLLPGAIQILNQILIDQKPNLLMIENTPVNNKVANYYLNHEALDVRIPSSVVKYFVHNYSGDLSPFIRLQSFIYKPDAIASIKYPSHPYLSNYQHWTCASLFFSLFLNLGDMSYCSRQLVAWRYQRDSVNTEVHDNWIYIQLVEAANLYHDFYFRQLISSKQLKIYLNGYILATADRISNFLKVFKITREIINLYRVTSYAQILILIFKQSIVKAWALLIKKLKHIIAKLRDKISIKLYPFCGRVSSYRLKAKPLNEYYFLNSTITVQNDSSISEAWVQMSQLFADIDYKDFRRKKPIVGIMSGGVEEALITNNAFLNELTSCSVGSLCLSRAAESIFGNPYLKIDSPIFSSLSILHIWYWYKLLLRLPSIENDGIVVDEYGGGFGGLCRIILQQSAHLISQYNIFDFPHINNLQYNYLRTVLQPILFTKVNFMGFYDCFENKVLDNNKLIRIFIATFSLSESSSSVFLHFLKVRLVDYSLILIAFQDVFNDVSNKDIIEEFMANQTDISANCFIYPMWKGASCLVIDRITQ